MKLRCHAPRLAHRRAWTLVALAVLLPACGGSAASPTSPSAAPATVVSPVASSLVLSSAVVANGGTLPPPYTCKSQTGLPSESNPPLAWSGAPPGTGGYVLLMSTIANDGGQRVTKYNWVLYDIPASATAIPENNTVVISGTTGTTTVGTPGLSSDGPVLSYSPPCSPKGSGLRTYTFTLYAVSRTPVFALNRVPGAGGDGANVAAALPGVTLAQASLTVSYTF